MSKLSDKRRACKGASSLTSSITETPFSMHGAECKVQKFSTMLLRVKDRKCQNKGSVWLRRTFVRFQKIGISNSESVSGEGVRIPYKLVDSHRN